MKTGSNIRLRKDGTYEARYIKGHTEEGKILWGYCYGATYEKAEEKRNRILANKTKTKCMNLLIVGAGSLGQEVYELVKNLRIFSKISFLDDDPQKDFVIGKCSGFEQYIDEYPIAIPAIGDNTKRLKWFMELSRLGFVIPSFIHPLASVSVSSEIGEGSVICAGATVGIDAKVGRSCILDSGSVVEKHAEVPDWTWVGCGEVVRMELYKMEKVNNVR